MNAADAPSEEKDGSRARSGPSTGERLKQALARVGRPLFSYRLEIGLGVTVAAIPFVRPTRAATLGAVCLKAGGLCLVLAGLGLRMRAAGFAGRHTRGSELGGSRLATTGPYAHVRNPIYLGSVFLGFGMVLLIGDRRLVLPCALTLLALYLGLIPAEEAYLSRQFQDEYEVYCRHVPRLVPRLRAWPGAVERPFDWRAAGGEWRLGLILAAIWGMCRAVGALRRSEMRKHRL
ncbi:MAG: isoprenylcysteine carboxylmethyltransferase family protein [Verrucomicrobia bacterium]|nr:isoprenylcysteine carboxylmethyltransferase family protein [Verrucomicrobiota bacterium]